MAVTSQSTSQGLVDNELAPNQGPVSIVLVSPVPNQFGTATAHLQTCKHYRQKEKIIFI